MKRPEHNHGRLVQSDTPASARSAEPAFRSLRSAAIAGDLHQLAVQVANNSELQSQLEQEVKACRAKIRLAFEAKTLSVSRSPTAGQILELDARVACELARRAVNLIDV